MQSQQKGHILKFIAKAKTIDNNIGIRTFPQQTYGVSEQSPDQFKLKHTLLADHGYLYQHQDKPEFQYPSQRTFFNVYHCQQLADPTKVIDKLSDNLVAFHRKKGRLSQFMDKNGWMSPVRPLMGFQRNENARALSNKDRQHRINSLKIKAVYDNPTAKKPNINPQYHNTISVVMAEKLRIRKQRQELVKQQGPATARQIPEKHNDFIGAQNVEEKMAKTNIDFYSTSSTFFPRNGTSPIKGRGSLQTRQFSSRVDKRYEGTAFNSSFKNKLQSPTDNYRTLSPPKATRASVRKHKIINNNPLFGDELNLQQWQRTSCHSKWVYKPKKVDSQEWQQMDKLQMTVNF